jgi:deaminated glutathione amidase
VQTYRKMHLFDVEIPEKNIRLKESDIAIAGDHIVLPVNTPVGHVGLCICYDLRFPELSIQLSKFGADILTYPSAFTYATGRDHWEVLLR